MSTQNLEYKECLLSAATGLGKCGPYKRYTTVIHGLTKICDLNRDTSDHFRNLNFKTILKEWTEQELIENRIGSNIDGSSLICPHHRYTLGTSWRPSKQCAHPLHPPVKRGAKSCSANLAPMWVVDQLNSVTQFSFVLGGRICREHLAVESSYRERLKPSNDEDEDEIENDIALDECLNELVQEEIEEYVPQEISVPEDLQSSSSSKGYEIADILCITPPRFQINKTPLECISKRTIREARRKIEQVKNIAVQRIAESIAPNQSEELLSCVFESDDDEEDMPADLVPLIEAFEDSDPGGKIIILSLVDTRHSRETIQKWFRCSRYYIDKARRITAQSTGVGIPPPKVIRRNRMNTYKCEHFIQFLFSSSILQDVAYGVTKLKFDSGEEQTIPHAVMTTRYSHAIAFYFEMCKEAGFEPLSESSLWRILRVLKPSQRKSLAGLDDITATGMNGFDTLAKFITKYKKDRDLIDRLEAGKRYLKTSYQTRCSLESSIRTHNAAYSLSVSKEEPCVAVGNDVCIDCFNLISALSDVLDIAENRKNEDDLYDANTAITDVMKYMNHQIRDYQQRQAKAYCFRSLSGFTAFWLKDFAQKVLPLRYREGQREYFGKKGMSLHIDVFFQEIDGLLLKRVYVTCIFRCSQSMVDVLNIGDHVIEEFKKDYPAVTQIYTKSDNAGSYHGNFMLEALYKMCRNKGLSLLRYDYNEPCKGKDQCDRESTGVKTLINSYVSSGCDLLTAEDVFNALHSGKGLKNTKVSVIEIDSATSSLEGAEIPNISSYHSAQFYPNHMKLYRYYNIGSGITVNYSEKNKFVSSYEVKKPFSHTQDGKLMTTPRRKKIGKRRIDHSICTLTFCTEPSCSDVFDTVEELERHILSENHTIPTTGTSMDTARSSFVKKMKASSQKHSSTISTLGEHHADISLDEAIERAPLMKRVSDQGWALPQRSNFRYSFEQKHFLYTIFIDGENTGKKKSPEEVAIMVRGNMKPSQYVTSQQIRSLFSTFSKKLKEGTLKPPQRKEENEIVEVEPKELQNESDDRVVNIQMEIIDETNKVMSKVCDWEVNDYVAVQYDARWYPGLISSINDDEIEVSCMKYVDILQSENKFRWPNRSEGNADVTTYERKDLLLKLCEPKLIGNNKRLQYFQLDEQDFLDASDILHLVSIGR